MTCSPRRMRLTPGWPSRPPARTTPATPTRTSMTNDDEPNRLSPGLVILDKPAGWTSHQVVGRVRRLLGTRKVGHAGTLDPMATGVLVLGVNRATRLLGQLTLNDKAYAATIRLGVTTHTDDAEGEVPTATGAADLGSGADRCGGRRADRGSSSRCPPRSRRSRSTGCARTPGSGPGMRWCWPRGGAGRAASRCATGGRPGRRRLPVVDLDVVVECSTGTYVRALARDLGAALGHRRTSDRAAPAAVRALFGGRGAADDRRSARAAGSGRGGPSLLSLADRGREDRYRGPPRPTAGRGSASGPRAALFADSGEFLALYRQQLSEAVPEAVFV